MIAAKHKGYCKLPVKNYTIVFRAGRIRVHPGKMKETAIMRRMKAEDKPHVLEMMRKFYSSDAVMTNGSEEIFSNDIEECISDSPFLEGFVFPDEEGKIKGYAMIAHAYSTEYGRHCIWIEDIYLEEEMRGSGSASEFFDYLKNQYPNSVNRLEVELENERAIASYRRNGFEDLPYHEMIRILRPSGSGDA